MATKTETEQAQTANTPQVTETSIESSVIQFLGDVSANNDSEPGSDGKCALQRSAEKRHSPQTGSISNPTSPKTPTETILQSIEEDDVKPTPSQRSLSKKKRKRKKEKKEEKRARLKKSNGVGKKHGQHGSRRVDWAKMLAKRRGDN
ncbi:hypothetical protein E4U55_000462 [Claviceps digitariae]|nr:hypothetical protein E4U55_000462 [Claviceps digitariae]